LYESEISFVGNLYERNRYDRIEPVLPDYLRGYLDASLWAQLQVSGGNLIQEMLTEEILLQLSDYFKLEKQEESFADLNLIFSSTVLGFKAANLERERGLNGLSLSHQVDLYTAGESGQLPLVCNKGKADYWKEMPLIFHHSKINLNFTIPNIIDGTPLRVWDILGCGGFCMTSWREDLLHHFENGKDLVIFEGKEDLLRKADYYLEHEEERRKIAENGYQKVKTFHTYDIRLREMFDVLKKQGVKVE
jgi:spore maturation protein CgeB